MAVTPTPKVKDMIFVKDNARDGESAPSATVIGDVVRDFYINDTEVPIIRVMEYVFDKTTRKSGQVTIKGGGKDGKYEFWNGATLVISDADMLTVLRKIRDTEGVTNPELRLPYNIQKGMSQEKLRMMPATGVTLEDADTFCNNTVPGRGHVTTVDEFSYAVQVEILRDGDS